ncbi:MAG: Ribonuclease J [Alphaproteobacteria bacterium MarineAlpha3_Bin5]|nr:MAG: Ribonuclease J [Alphaproteobacteria bacterium MarineAlpha3_Bin5]
MKKNLYFLPLGGTGEIGMNLNLYGWGPQKNPSWIMVDLGVMFGEHRAPGVDLVTPDPSFIEEKKDQLLGIVLTHAHEDHLGGIPYLWNRLGCKVYATPFAVSILQRKLSEFNLNDKIEIIEVELGSKFSIGPFNLEMISLTHSIPEPNAIAIRTPAGTVLHTGDWKFDPEPITGEAVNQNFLSELGSKGVKAIVCDSTNVFSPGHSGSEGELEKNLFNLASNCNGKVVIACFASNVARLTTISKVAISTNRKVVLAGRSLWRIEAAARENGYLSDIPNFLKEEEVQYINDENLLIICTGSQGEPRAALSRISEGNHRYISVGEGDRVVFSSKIIPGNEKAIADLQNSLIRRGVEVITENDALIHVSGHPNRGELTKMYQYIKPEIAIPVHGEIRHLKKHAALARECQVKNTFVIENGTIVCLGPDEPSIVEHVTSGRLSYEGNRLVPITGKLVKNRTKALYSGFAVITVLYNIKGELVTDPQITTTGLLNDGDDEIIHEIFTSVRSIIENLSGPELKKDATVNNAVRLTTRRIFRTRLNKNAMVKVHLLRL